MSRTRRALVAAALLATACASPVPSFVFPRSSHVEVSDVPTALNVNWDTGLPVVEVYVDGHGPLRFMLDSGAAFYVIAERTADELKLARIDAAADGKGPEVTAAGGETSFRHVVRIHEFRAGPLVEHDTGAALFDLSLAEQVTGARLDGIVPATAFRDALLTFDFPGKTVTVSAGNLPDVDGQNVLSLEPYTVACINIEIGGFSCPLVVDTGGLGSLRLPATAGPSLKFRSEPVVVGRDASLAGQTSVSAARLDGTIALGRHAITHPVVELSAGRLSSVGVDILREFRITFDFSHRRIRLDRRDDDGPIVSRPERSLGMGLLRKNGAWTVEYVLDDSPAAQVGVQVGDCVETIDGRAIDETSFEQRMEMIRAKDAIPMRVRSVNGTTREITVLVKTFVE